MESFNIKIKGFFKDFHIDKYHAYHKDKKILLWIANGFMFFKDEGAYFSNVPFDNGVPLLTGFGWFERRALWKELKREIKRRQLNLIKET